MKDWPWKNFYPEEFSCRCNKCGSTGFEMKDLFMRCMCMLREKHGEAIIINRGYSCPAHNASISSSGLRGEHTLGMATDIKAWGEKAFKIIELAPKVGFTRIGLKQHGPVTGRFIHLGIATSQDGFPSPTVFTYP
jgi:hypothetical protein